MDKDTPITISRGNIKLGNIPSFSLLPGATCSARARKTCFLDGCYAVNYCKFRPSVAAAYAKNTAMAKTHLSSVVDQLSKFLGRSSVELFRVHVGGDFFSPGYFNAIMSLARKHRKTTFLAYTKQFDNINLLEVPKNFNLVLSVWDDVKELGPFARAGIPKAYVINPGDKIPTLEPTIVCPGDCTVCKACFSLKATRASVAFHKH
jgi:hypothetical protein